MTKLRAALELKQVRKAFGSLSVLEDITLSIEEGECRAIVGPNGAGKTTLFNIIAGSVKADGGTLQFGTHSISSWTESRRARAGIRRTFQHSNLFDGLSVQENVSIAVLARQGRGYVFYRPSNSYIDACDEVESLLLRVGLWHRARSLGADLSHGERRQVEIAMALAGAPRVLLLDEPTAGMSPGEADEFVGRMKELGTSLTTLIVEHDLDVVFAMADVVSVMNRGTVVVEGTPDEVRSSPIARDAYFGTARQDHARREEN